MSFILVSSTGVVDSDDVDGIVDMVVDVCVVVVLVVIDDVVVVEDVVAVDDVVRTRLLGFKVDCVGISSKNEMISTSDDSDKQGHIQFFGGVVKFLTIPPPKFKKC